MNNYHLNYSFFLKSLPLLDSQVYDAIIVYQGMFRALLHVAQYRFKTKMFISYIHGEFSYKSDDHSMYRKLYRRIDKVVCVSKNTKVFFDNMYPEYANKSLVIYNAIDIDKKVQESRKPVFETLPEKFLLTVGRLSYEKGQDMIPDICRKLYDLGYDLPWYIIGDGNNRDSVEEKNYKYHMEHHVICLGKRINPYPYIARCYIYVQPSYREGYCTTTLEAKILKKPVIATNVAGMQEQFLNGFNGFICDVDPDDICKRIQFLLDSPEIIDEITINLGSENLNHNQKNMNDLYNLIENGCRTKTLG